MTAPAYVYAASVIRVVDGDTVWLDIDLGFRVHISLPCRLAGVDTPEVRGAERPEGLEAKAFVESLLPRGSSIVATSLAKLDKYGRGLVRITLPDGRDLGETLLKAGHAEPYDG